MMMHTRKLSFGKFSGTLVGLACLAFLVPACTADDEDPTLATSEAIGEASDAIHTIDGTHIGSLGLLDAKVPSMNLGMRCDLEPEVTSIDVCGESLPGTAHFEWTDCAMPGPRDEMKRHGMGGTSAGTIDVTNALEGFDSSSCDVRSGPTSSDSQLGTTASDITQTQNVTFSIEGTGHRGMTRTLAGTAQSTSTRPMDADIFTRSTTLDVSRTMKDEDGEVVHSIHLTGTVDVAVDLSAETPTRILNGTLNATHEDEETAVITLSNIVRTTPDVCRWPTSGTLTRTVADTTHTLVFGPQCGEATLDGQSTELEGGCPDGRM